MYSTALVADNAVGGYVGLSQTPPHEWTDGATSQHSLTT